MEKFSAYIFHLEKINLKRADLKVYIGHQRARWIPLMTPYRGLSIKIESSTRNFVSALRGNSSSRVDRRARDDVAASVVVKESTSLCQFYLYKIVSLV